MKKAIRLVETRRGCAPFEKEPRYDVLFNGVLFDQLYFNTRGYVGYLPAPRPDGTAVKLNLGERGIGSFKKRAAELNKEWAALAAA